MRQQPITDDGFLEAEALHLVRACASGSRHAPQTRAADATSRRSVLARTVEDEVIPRLLLARRRTGLQCGESGPQEARLSASHVASLVALLLNSTQAEVIGFVESLRAGGVTIDTLCLELLAPSACRLGVMWEEDACDFTDVTVGVLRLANVMRLMTGAFEAECLPSQTGKRALLVQMPGEQHGLGLAMVVYFFRRAGWWVDDAPSIAREELIALVRREWFCLVGVSVACGDRMAALAADIRAIRAASLNPSVGIMVGGKPFIDDPRLAALVGADTTATDGKQAVQQAQDLVSRLARSR